MSPDVTDSPMVRLQKKVLANLKLKLKGSTSPDINVLVKRDIEELEQKIKRIIDAEKRNQSEL
jgi:hypothetical protein